MSDPLEVIRQQLAQLERERARGPGIARCAPPACAEDLRKLGAKHEARRRINALWPDLSQRRIAENKFGIDESTLRGQLDPRVMNREPSEKVLQRLDDYEELARLAQRIGGVI
jgi:hypothetical protein